AGKAGGTGALATRSIDGVPHDVSNTKAIIAETRIIADFLFNCGLDDCALDKIDIVDFGSEVPVDTGDRFAQILFQIPDKSVDHYGSDHTFKFSVLLRTLI